MIVDKKGFVEEELEGVFEEIDAELSIEDMDLIFSIVSDNFYSDIYGSIVREIASNCIDSHTEAGVDSPVLVSGVIEEDTSFIVFSDSGTGLSPEKFEKVYMRYFRSTKRDSNAYVGYFGIGSKSPLGYTDSFEVITRFEGTRYHYIVGKSETGRPKATLMNTSPTDLGNGTDIKIAIHRGDWSKFEKAIQTQLTYFDNVYVSGFNFDNGYSIVEGETFKLRGNLNDSSVFNYESLHVCFGRVVYPINWEQLGRKKIDLPMGVKFDIGELKVTNNREQLVYNDETKELINRRIDNLLEEIRTLYNERNTEDSSFVEYIKNRNLSKYLTLGGLTVFLPTERTYNERKHTYVDVDSIKGLNGINYSEFKGTPLVMPEDPFFLFEVFHEAYRNTRKSKSISIKLDLDDVVKYRTLSKTTYYRVKEDRLPSKDKFLLWKEIKRGKQGISLIRKKTLSKFQLRDAVKWILPNNEEEKKKAEKARKKISNNLYDYDIEDRFFTSRPVGSVPYITEEWNKTKLFKFYRKVITRELVELTESYEKTLISEEYKQVLKAQRELNKKIKVQGEIKAYDLGSSGDVTIVLSGLKKFKGLALFSYRGDTKRIRALYDFFSSYYSKRGTVKGYTIGKTFLKNIPKKKNFMTVDNFMTTESSWLKILATAIIVQDRFKNLEGKYENLMTYLSKFNPELEGKRKEIERFINKSKAGLNSLDSLPEFKKELLFICKEKGWFIEKYINLLEDLENFVEDLNLISYLPRIAFVEEDGVKEVVDFLKVKKKRLDSIHYFIPNEFESKLLEEAERHLNYKKELEQMRRNLYRYPNLFYSTPYFN